MPELLFNLVVEVPDEVVKYYLLDRNRISIGRDGGQAITVEDETISGRHCELRRRGKRFSVIDSGSTNGTLLNGEAVGEEAEELRPGDQISLGPRVKARFVRVVAVGGSRKASTSEPGSATQKLAEKVPPERPEINPVAAAVAKASKQGKGSRKR